MDALSEALSAVRVRSALFFSGEFSAPWRFYSHSKDTLIPVLSPGQEHMLLFHLVTDGHAVASTQSQDDLPLGPGDIVVFPHGDAHEVWDGRSTKRYPSNRLLKQLAHGDIAHEKWGGGGRVARIICGFFGCERQAESLFLSGLPAMFKINVRARPASSWLEHAIRQSIDVQESHRPGRIAVLSRLAESLVIETLCTYAENLPRNSTGWLAAARDSIVGRSLGHLHRDPARDWTLPLLAKSSGTSRTVLAERFARFLGESPFAYLSRWRLHLGARMLATTEKKILAIAADVGYESEAAFSRAFRRAYAVPPSQFRRNNLNKLRSGD